MNIYFAGSIRGGRGDAGLYDRIIRFLMRFGNVLTEHIGSASLTEWGDIEATDSFIHDRDMNWLLASDVIVAEVTTISAGVGYEIGRAVALGKMIICLYREQPGKRLSAMIAGCPHLTVIKYEKPEEAEKAILEFLNENISLKTAP
jgi:2'-deoxynucleoside 5'-phosphate N-hydrolase